MNTSSYTINLFIKSIMISLGLFCISLNAQSLEKYGFKYPSKRVLASSIRLKTLNNQNYDSKQDKGKLILLHFWATWCKPCIKELPELNELNKKIDTKKMIILTVNVDRSNEKKVRSMVQKIKLELPVLLDPDGIVRNAYDVEVFPTTFVIAPDGKFVARLTGAYNWSTFDLKTLHKYLKIVR